MKNSFSAYMLPYIHTIAFVGWDKETAPASLDVFFPQQRKSLWWARATPSEGPPPGQSVHSLENTALNPGQGVSWIEMTRQMTTA